MTLRTGKMAIRWGLLRGESAVASIGAAVVVILLVTLTASGAWLIRTQRAVAESARVRQIETVADMLAVTAEPVLAVDPGAVRRQVMDAAVRYELSRCRLVTEAGNTLADSIAGRIDAVVSSAILSAAPTPPETLVQTGFITVRRSVMVPKRGWAVLEVRAPVATEGHGGWEAQAGVGAISAMSLFALLLVYRYHRSKLLGLGAVREALIEMHCGEKSEAALQVASNLGVESDQWNTMLSEQQRLRRLAAAQQTKQALGALTGEEDDELSGACDAMPQGLVIVDESLRVTYANHAAGLFLRQARDTIRGAQVDTLTAVPELQKAIREAVAAGRRATHVADRRHEPGGSVLRFVVRPIRRGDANNAMLVIDDVTQQRVAEEARHEFVAHATHELRSPLTNIRLYLENLLDEQQSDPGSRAKSLNVINTETRRLERMVGDLLSVAEIEAGSLKLLRNDVDLIAELRDIERDYAVQAAEKRVELIVELPPKLPVLQADRDKLIMAIQNVVGNALKYTPAGGTVRLTAEQTRSGITMEVRDTGIGIKPEEQEKIFEKFYRAGDKRVAGVTGSGLGLPLARDVVRLHGGDITVESQIDQGSVFTIQIPLGEAA